MYLWPCFSYHKVWSLSTLCQSNSKSIFKIADRQAKRSTTPQKKSPNLWGINMPCKFSLSLFWFDNWCIGTHNKFPPLNTSNTDPFRWGPIILHLLAISIHFGVGFDALKFHKIIFHMQICHYYQPSTCHVFTFSFVKQWLLHSLDLSLCEFELTQTFMIQTASMTSLTPLGGLAIALTREMSFCFSVSKAEMAAFKAGMAIASFASHSSYRKEKFIWKVFKALVFWDIDKQTWQKCQEL